MVPAAVVQRDERHPRLDEPPRQKGALAERIAAISVAHALRLAVDVERGLGFTRTDQVVALLVLLIEGVDRIARFLIEDARHAIDLAANLTARIEASFR